MPARKKEPEEDLEARFESWYRARREREEAEARSKEPPQSWEEFQERLRQIVREENESFFSRLFGDSEEEDKGRPPSEKSGGGGFFDTLSKAWG
jgi:hypothetical protein